MRHSRILQTIAAGKVARVATLGTNLPYFPALAAHAGFDAVWVDGEHRAWDARELEALIARHHGVDIDCIFRPPTNSKTSLSRLLEDGVTALMMPQVNTAAEAALLVQHAKFPPLGERGLDGSGADGGYGLQKTPQYPAEANRETLLIVMIETPQALANLDDIAAVAGVDMLFMGPGDLSLRLGSTSAITDAKILAAVKQMAAACAHHGKPWGFPANDPEHARIAVDLGCRMLCISNEQHAVQRHLFEKGAQFDALLGKPS